MEEGAKRRLVGATVMVVLVVIFLPMLLEEESQSPVSEREMSIPPRPDFEQGFNSSVFDGTNTPPVSAIPEYREPESDLSSGPQELAPPALFDTPATAEPEFSEQPALQPDSAPEPTPALVEESTPAAKPKPEAKSAAVPEPPSAQPPEPPPTPTPASTGLSSWVIQVASLRERARAYSLVQDLRTKGFPAYIEEAQVRQKLWHRVRIGPEVERKRIESLAASLRAKTGLNGQIQRYP